MKRILLISALFLSLCSAMCAQYLKEPLWMTSSRNRTDKQNAGYGYSHSFGVGTTFTDYCITFRYGYQFQKCDGLLGRIVSGNGFYAAYGAGTYPEWNLAGAEHHDKWSAGIMIGSMWREKGWWPTVNLGISRHWYTTYPGYKETNDPVFDKWAFEFGSSGQIGHFYPWVIVSSRQMEMTFGIGVIF
jgi:hypothetical protein